MKSKNRVSTALPNGLVLVDKGSEDRQVMIGLLNGKNMPTFGFDLRGMAPNHFRIVENGKFGVVIGARQAVEVRILLDGKVLTEKVLHPKAHPSRAGMDPELYKRMVESPQAHYLLEDADGNPFMFEPHDRSLSDDVVIAEQIHPGRETAPPTLHQIDRDGTVLEDFKVDLDPADFGFMPPNPTDIDSDVSASEHAARAADKLAAEDSADAAVSEDSADADDAEFDGRSGFTHLKADDESQTGGRTIDLNPATHAKSWAPSHGLVAVGVRMVQTVPEGEIIPTAPDGFHYTLFQMNPWKLHNKVHAKVMGRVIVPSTQELARMVADEGFEEELSGHDQASCSCGLKHKHHH